MHHHLEHFSLAGFMSHWLASYQPSPYFLYFILFFSSMVAPACPSVVCVVKPLILPYTSQPLKAVRDLCNPYVLYIYPEHIRLKMRRNLPFSFHMIIACSRITLPRLSKSATLPMKVERSQFLINTDLSLAIFPLNLAIFPFLCDFFPKKLSVGQHR